MTEPAVASSDATNIESVIRREGDEYVINGHKWYTTGATDPRCKLIIFMGKTDAGNADRYRQQSMILVPKETPGVNVIRPIPVFGFYGVPDRAQKLNSPMFGFLHRISCWVKAAASRLPRDGLDPGAFITACG